MEVIVTEKRCSSCKKVLSIDRFYRNRTKQDGLQSQCKSCTTNSKEYIKNWRSKNIDKIRGYSRERFFGVTNKTYEDMLNKQDRKCAICKKEKDVYCIDHNHVTGNIRGLLCRKCNVGLGMFEDNIQALTNAIWYLIANTTE